MKWFLLFHINQIPFLKEQGLIPGIDRFVKEGLSYLRMASLSCGIQVWLARSDDHRTWINIQDEPVLNKGPEKYDFRMLAANQVVKYKDRYYMYYHGLHQVETWTSDVAMSKDLIHWVKYPMNPIVQGDHSSPILVLTSGKYRLYTMHPSICLYFSK